jgi:hypothetical protein
MPSAWRVTRHLGTGLAVEPQKTNEMSDSGRPEGVEGLCGDGYCLRSDGGEAGADGWANAQAGFRGAAGGSDGGV